MLKTLQPFFISFLIGLIIGIERERSQSQSKKSIGMRTFILFAFLGTLTATINHVSITLSISLFIFLAILISYCRASEDSKRMGFGLTTEMAAATVYLLGYLASKQTLLAVILATVVLVILYGKRSLHRFAKEKITAQEIEASIIILIISLGIISFLPDKTIDPWHLFNPQNFGMIVLILAGLQFGGYIAIRIFGQQLGMILIGFFGGLVSSTAVFATLAGTKRFQKKLIFSAVVAGIFATIATLTGFLVVIFFVIPSLLQQIIWPILAAILFGGASSLVLMRKKNLHRIKMAYPNPLDIKAVIKLALLIMGILLLVGLTQQYVGTELLPLTAFITGLIEIHGIAYALALLYKENSLTLTKTTELLAIVICASFISKFILVWLIAHNRFSLIVSIFLFGMLSAGAIVFFLVTFPNFI